MKKSLLALAVLATLAGSAAAQSSISMYGVLDAGINYQTSPITSGAGNQLTLGSGMSTPSRIGFSGSEDFGTSMRVLFQIEAGLQLNNGQSQESGTLFDRASWVGLGGDFGTVTIGRQFTPMYNALYSIDPFELGMAGNAGNLMHLGGANATNGVLIGGNNPLLLNGGGSMLQNNSMHYLSHDYDGFSFEYNHGFGQQPGDRSNGAENGFSLYFDRGPVHLLAAYDAVNSLDNSNTFKSTLVGGTLDWSDYGVPVKTSIGYQTNRGTDLLGGTNIDSTDLLLGLKVPLGRHQLMASYIHLNNNLMPGGQADQYALGYAYELSKRSWLYCSVGETRNRNGAAFTVGNASTIGYGTKSFDMGIRHSF